MSTKGIAILGIVILMALGSCSTNTVTMPAPDVSSISIELDLVRYDKQLSNIDPDNPNQSYLDLITEYPVMTDLYFKQLTNLYDEDATKFNKRIEDFANDERISSLADTVATIFKDTRSVEKELTLSLKYLKHYFPIYALPRFYTLYSEFSYQSFIFQDHDGKDAIGLGLDLFLGDDFDYKKIDPSNVAFSSYLTRAYNKDHVSKKAVEMIAEDMIGKPNGKRFIDLMIHQGKKQYILERLMPHVSDTIRWEYTPTQLAWVQENELQIWDFFLDKNLIYETSHLKTANYLQPAPHSKGMPDGAPGRTASYIGYKIITSYMKRNPDLTLSSLLDINDAQDLLEKARYKPARK